MADELREASKQISSQVFRLGVMLNYLEVSDSCGEPLDNEDFRMMVPHAENGLRVAGQLITQFGKSFIAAHIKMCDGRIAAADVEGWRAPSYHHATVDWIDDTLSRLNDILIHDPDDGLREWWKKLDAVWMTEIESRLAMELESALAVSPGANGKDKPPQDGPHLIDDLTTQEVRLLEFLWSMNHATYDDLRERVWGKSVTDDAIEKAVTRLNPKLLNHNESAGTKFNLRCKAFRVYLDK